MPLLASDPVPVPAANVNAITVGAGYVDHVVRQVIRTHNDVVYVITADDAACQLGGSGVIHAWKGTGAQAANSRVPTGFVELDSANRPTSGGSGSCLFAGGIRSMVLSPDIRLDSNDLIHLAYMDGSNGNIYYQTFSTASDTWGARTVVGTGGNTDSGGSWPRTGQVSLTLDANDVPHIVYATSGTSNSLRHVHRVTGSWSTPITVATGNNIMHPSLVTSLDGALHLSWLSESISTHSNVKYSKSTSTGIWSAAETVNSGDALVLSNTNLDQGPSIATDRNNLPHVLYLDGTSNGSDNYVRMRYRNSAGVWTDNTPPGTSGGASNPNGNWYTHAPQCYIGQTGDVWVFLGHDTQISAGGYERQVGGPGNLWSAYSPLDPRNQTNTTAGAPGLDGSASIRFDPLRDNNPGIIDVLIFDENDGTAGYDHHATVYYKAIILDITPDTAPPSDPTNLVATALSSSQISLSWTASTDNIGVAGYRIFRNGVQAGSTVSPGYIDGNLTANTSYQYAVLAFDNAGNVSALSPSVPATTLAGDTLPPTIPANFSATPVASSAMKLAWAASTDNVQVAGYRLYRNGTQIAAISTTTYSDSGLAAGATYTYSIEAIDAAGNLSVQRASATATMPAAQTAQSYTLFGAATPVVADVGTDRSVELGVKFTSDVAGQVTAIRFYKATANKGTHTVALWSSTGVLLGSATASGETASGWQTVTLNSPVTISAGTTYTASYHAPSAHYAADKNYFSAKYDKAPLHAPANAGVYVYGTSRAFPTSTRQASNYWVDVVLSTGQSVADTVAPSVPSGLTATPVSTSKVTLAWVASTDNVGVAGYKIFRDGTQVNTTTTNSYADLSVTAAASYVYTVSAYDAAGNSSAQTSPVPVSTPSDVDTDPPTLSAATVSSITTTGAVISWTTDENADTQVEYGLTNAYGLSSPLVTTLTSAHTVSLNSLTADTGYHFRIRSKDAANNIAVSGDYTFTTLSASDTTAPSVSISAPLNLSNIGGTVNVVAEASDAVGVTKVEFYLDGALVATDATAPYTWSFDTTAVSEGGHSLQARAYDAANNSGVSSQISITVSNADTTAPTVSITSPAGSSTVSGTVTVAASASDSVGVVRVEFYLDGVLKATDTTAPYSWSFDTTQVANGSHSLQARAYDAANNTGTSSTVAVTVSNADTTAPTVSITSPAGSSTVSGTVTVAASASDSVGVVRVEFYLDGALKATDTTAPYSWSFDTTQIANGSHSLQARAYDAANNTGTSSTVAVTVSNADTTAPTVSITSPAGSSTVSGTVTVAASAFDSVGVVRVEFYLDGALKATDTTAPYSWSFDTSQVSNGSHSIQARAYDAANNTGTSSTISVTVSNVTAGSIALVQSSSGNVLNTSQVSVAMPAPITTGNLVVVAISCWPSAPATTAITDNLGNTYTLAGQTRRTASGAYTGIWYAKSVVGGTATITFRTASGGSELSMVAAEFSGANTAAPLDAATGATGSSSAPSSGNMTPSATGDLVIGAGTHDGTEVTSAGSGFTLIAVTSENSNVYQPLAMEFKIQATTSATAATFSLSKSDTWAQAGALFKR
jgi:chitodextrinase/sulfur relay (sulfurtransferase) DsrF/TusC family protein